MKLSTITASEVVGTLRFDSQFHLSRESPLMRRLRLGEWTYTSVAQTFGGSTAWMPNRFTRVWADGPEFGKPMLVPYDAFRYMPWSRSYLSQTQVKEYQKAQLDRFTLLIVRSGRNLGPVTMADTYLSKFTMSDDMIRIPTDGSDDAFYFYALLSTPTGQELVRRDRNGSVIDHLGPDQIAALRYPLVKEKLRMLCARLFRDAFQKREEGRNALDEAQRDFLAHFGLGEHSDVLRKPVGPRRFTVCRSTIGDRIDAEVHGPGYAKIREQILMAGGRRLGNLAQVTKPPSRYKTTYVTDKSFGIPLMNGRQVSQYRPIALKLMNVSAFKDPLVFEVRRGMTLLTADGRAEENLADCVMVTDERHCWGASGHVHRVIPNASEEAGLIYLACASPPVQAQLKALATGSVVDALSEDDVRGVAIPYDTSDELREIGHRAVAAWRLFSKASRAEQRAISLLEAAFAAAPSLRAS